MAEYREARREARRGILGDILWSYADVKDGRRFDGGILDESSSGMSIVTHMPVREGHVLKIIAQGMWEEERLASVIWCKEIFPNIYRSGLLLSREVRPRSGRSS